MQSTKSQSQDQGEAENFKTKKIPGVEKNCTAVSFVTAKE
jgi:hypothetical protein